MKKIRKTQVFFIIIIMILVSSCSTTTYSLIVDEKSYPEQTASVLFNNKTIAGWFYVLGWNNTDIEERVYGKARKYSWGYGPNGYSNWDETILIVPDGNNRIIFDMTISYTDSGTKTTEYKSRNIVLEYNFAAGKQYEVRGRVDKSKSILLTTKIFAQLYDITSEAVLLREWNVPRDFL